MTLLMWLPKNSGSRSENGLFTWLGSCDASPRIAPRIPRISRVALRMSFSLQDHCLCRGGVVPGLLKGHSKLTTVDLN